MISSKNRAHTLGAKPVKCREMFVVVCVTEMSDFEDQGCSSVIERFEKAPVDALANVPKISMV